MKVYIILKIILLFCFFEIAFHFQAKAQFNITYPAERSVFQRVNNVASVHIGGNILYQDAKIEAKLSPINGGQSMNWQEVNVVINRGQFYGEITYVSTGWYKLELRAVINGTQIGNIATINKVGVGEVFIIAGQSNAQGGSPPTGGFYTNTKFGATDDRVNCIDFLDESEQSLLPFPKISHLNAQTYLAPHGKASWCWGKLGDKIAQELNCPVLFFNAAEGGTRIEQWAQAAKGEPTNNFYENRVAPQGWPYAFLQKSLNYYASLYGLRAVLWHQGEEDGFLNTNQEKYRQALETLIVKSREHTGKNISWLVAKVSRSRVGTKETIINAQQAIIDKPNFNVFLGPETDEIQPNGYERDDLVHFRENGLIQLADAWANKIINEKFLLESKPFLANKLIGINLENCLVQNEINASLPVNYASPIWVWNGGASKLAAQQKKIVAFDENYGLVRDQNSNYLISPPFSYMPPSLDIVVEGTTKICSGEKLKISANTINNNYEWNSSETTKVIFIEKAGETFIKLSSSNIYGCKTTSETKFDLKILPLPKAPIIESVSATTFCEGESVELRGIESDNYSKIWSTQWVGNSVKIENTGQFFMQNIDENGCKSVSSNIVNVTVHPKPKVPTIDATNGLQFCKGDSLKLSTSNSSEFFWYINNEEYKTKLPTLFAKKAGNYSVKLKNEFGCISAISEIVKIIENDLPSAPFIYVNGKLNLCAGASSQLITDNIGNSYNWYSSPNNIEASTTNVLNISTDIAQNTSEKLYFLKITDNNNCVSARSNSLKITTKANPAKPIIEATGPLTLSFQGKNEENSTYNWIYNNAILTSNTPAIKAVGSGEYKLSVVSTYTIDNEVLKCQSQASNGVNFNSPMANIFVYPNPVNAGFLYIENKNNVVANSIKLFTFLGQQVFSGTNVNLSSRQSIATSHLKGLYILELLIDGEKFTKNIFIEK